MSADNEDRLLDIVRIVDSLPAETPEQRSRLLLQSTASGKNVFDSFRSASASSPTDINRSLEPLGETDDTDAGLQSHLESA